MVARRFIQSEFSNARTYSNASVTEVNVDVSDGDPWGKREAAQHGLRRLHPATAAHTGRAVSENYVRSLQQG